MALSDVKMGKMGDYPTSPENQDDGSITTPDRAIRS
jgi:hypothetical protein